MITIEQSDASIRDTFYNMEEGAEYVLNDFWFQETNRVRKEYFCSPLKDKKDWKLTRKGDKLFVKKRLVFDFTGKSNIIFTFAKTFASTVADAATLAVAFALQYNGIEKS